MHNRTTGARRGAFTLIEMLVVIALILILLTIAAAMFPRFAENHRILKGADQIATMLLNARQRALRDGKPVGVRIEFEGNSTTANRLIFIKQVDDFSQANTRCNGGTGQPDQVQVAFTGTPFRFDPTYYSAGGQADLAPVLNGDYLEVNGGGLVTMIVRVANNNTLITRSPIAAGPYRIIRQPRAVEGEAALDLPQNIVVREVAAQGSQNLPVRSVSLYDSNGNTQRRDYVEILFAPGGGVVGRGTTSGENIILWVQDSTKPGLEGSPLLVSVHTRTGMVAVHSVNIAGPDLYSFTRDGRSSGL